MVTYNQLFVAGICGQRSVHYRDRAQQRRQQVRADGARQDPAAQRLRLHHGHAQEGGGLHQEDQDPEYPGGQERSHTNLTQSPEPVKLNSSVHIDTSPSQSKSGGLSQRHLSILFIVSLYAMLCICIC